MKVIRDARGTAIQVEARFNGHLWHEFVQVGPEVEEIASAIQRLEARLLAKKRALIDTVCPVDPTLADWQSYWVTSRYVTNRWGTRSGKTKPFTNDLMTEVIRLTEYFVRANEPGIKVSELQAEKVLVTLENIVERKKLTPGNKGRLVRYLGMMLRDAHKYGCSGWALTSSPWALIGSEKIKLPEVQFIPEADLAKIAQKCLENRYRGSIPLLLECTMGLRSEESYALRWEWIDPRALTVSWPEGVRKGEAAFTTSIPPSVFAMLGRPRLEGFVFDCTKDALNYALRAILRELGFDHLKITPHTIRHAFATSLYLNDVDMKTISGLLGHKHMATTERYIQSALTPIRLKATLGDHADRLLGPKTKAPALRMVHGGSK